MKVLAVIPARYASSRFPGKPLAMIAGKSMIQRVYEQVLKSNVVDSVIVATDDSRIETVVKTFDGNVMMTSVQHASGTSRCAQAAAEYPSDFDIVINVQGDEPFVDPMQLELLVRCFEVPAANIATLVKRISKPEELANPNVVKVVLDERQQALYFSRSPIPFLRDVEAGSWLSAATFYKHIGIYGFRKNILQQLVKLPVNDLEQAESLEQLRWLANGFAIHTAITDRETMGIDTPEDLETANVFAREHD